MSSYIVHTIDGPSFEYETEGTIIVNQSNGERVRVPEDQIINGAVHSKGYALRIVMGTKCNYDCKYCSQGSSKDALQQTIADVESFLLSAGEIIDGAGKIEFWGGEPLVYIKYLEKLVPALRERLPNTLFTMISNGSLFSDYVGEFLEKYCISFSISHDTYAHEKTRGQDPFNDPKIIELIQKWYPRIDKALGKLHKHDGERFCGISTVISRECFDMNLAQKWVNDKLGMYVPVYCGTLISVGNASGNTELSFSEDELKSLASSALKAGLSEVGVAPYSIAEDGMTFVRAINKGINPYEKSFPCGIANGRMFVVDLRGNLYKCQNFAASGNSYTNAFDSGLTPPKTGSFNKKKSCLSCPVVSLCRGGCPFAEGNDFVETCNIKFWWSLGIFASAFTRVTGYVPYHIEGKVVRPESELIQTSHGKFREMNGVDIPFPSDWVSNSQ